MPERPASTAQPWSTTPRRSRGKAARLAKRAVILSAAKDLSRPTGKLSRSRSRSSKRKRAQSSPAAAAIAAQPISSAPPPRIRIGDAMRRSGLDEYKVARTFAGVVDKLSDGKTQRHRRRPKAPRRRPQRMQPPPRPPAIRARRPSRPRANHHGSQRPAPISHATAAAATELRAGQRRRSAKRRTSNRTRRRATHRNPTQATVVVAVALRTAGLRPALPLQFSSTGIPACASAAPPDRKPDRLPSVLIVPSPCLRPAPLPCLRHRKHPDLASEVPHELRF